MKKWLSVFSIMFIFISKAQSPWIGQSWSASQNLTSVMNAAGVLELSGCHWNPTLNRLYVCEGTGRVRILQYNSSTSTYSQIASFTGGFGGTEGITQVNYNSNQFYVVDENNYRIKQITHSSVNNYSGASVTRYWDMLVAPSPMTNTGNSGPEGIEFIPDSYLSAIGFISEQTNLPYTSTKGMGGLLFIAHQNSGFIWVFDCNPLVNDDFVYVGKYKTNKNESCGLEFERSSGLLYIMHNIGGNCVEVTDLSSAIVSTNRKFVVKEEYIAPNNGNIEGIAVSTSCADSMNMAWFVRDAEAVDPIALQQDVLRAGNPFYPVLTPSITTNAPICVGQTLSLSSNTAISATYNWIGPNSFSAAAASTSMAANSSTFSGSYSLSIAAHGCTVTTAKSITINPLPSINVNSGAICMGSTFTIAPSGASSYTFSNGPIVSPTTSTSYSVTGTSTAGCVSSSAAVCNVTVNPLPTINVSTSDTLLCIGQSATLTANGASNYTFNPGGVGSNIIISPSATTNYTVVGTSTQGCSNTAIFMQSTTVCTDLEQIAHSISEIRVYPNPNNGNFNLIVDQLTATHFKLQINSTSGQLVYSDELSESNAYSITISDKFPNGIYFLKVINGINGQANISKLIINR